MPRRIVVGVWILFLVVLTTRFVGWMAGLDLLIPAAFALPLLPIGGMFWLRPAEERIGWSVFTVWLGSTYVASGLPADYVVFGLAVLCAVLGYLRSGWWFVGAWLGHILWDFAPHDLPARLQDLPTACLIFDGLIGAFLAWQVWRGRWQDDDHREGKPAAAGA